MRIALIVMLASLLLLIGWISIRMARSPEPGRRNGRRGGYIPHDGGGTDHGHGDGDGGGGGGGGGGH
jgi:hypothetical protein